MFVTTGVLSNLAHCPHHYAEKLPPGFFGEHSGFFDGI